MSTQAKPFRYQLPKKSIKIDCPQCSNKKTFSRYVDTETGETLPEQYGRCDKANGCGHDLNPYHKDASGVSYATEVNGMGSIPHEWFKIAAKWKRQHTSRESIASTLIMEGATPQQAEQVIKFLFVRPAHSAQPTPTAPIYCIPDEVFRQSIGHYDQNQFARLLQRQFGKTEANQLLHRFQIGTSSRWPGACVFWFIDEHGHKRGGQIKLFDSTFHTAKYVDREGKKRSKTSWVHSALTYRIVKAGLSIPDWLTIYNQHAECSPCLFGLPQLLTEPTDSLIGIVEAPKTAVVCTHYLPDFIWLAVGALSYLNAERLAPLRGRAVVLFPDLSKDGKAFERWSKVADELNKKGYQISVSDLLERGSTNQQKEQGLDLADFLLNVPTIVHTLAEWAANPGSICHPDESQIERLTVDTCNTYPAEWDK